MADCQTLLNILQAKFAPALQQAIIKVGELTIEIDSADLLEITQQLRDDPELHFEIMSDLCGVDYLHYGLSEWETEQATTTGFSRGVSPPEVEQGGFSEVLEQRQETRFAVVYHLLSLKHNHRLRLRTFAKGEPPILPSITQIWNAANWYEREAFDLYGILFEGHPDLRRILTDYGFIGHPFRKDFPLIGTVEMRYSAQDQRVIYEAVSIPPRTLVPKTIRNDNRYIIEQEKQRAQERNAQEQHAQERNKEKEKVEKHG